MDYARKTLIFFSIFTGVGVIALLAALFVHLPDGYRMGFISGIAGGFICTGTIGIIISALLMKNPKRAAEIELGKNEERTQLIRMKINSAIYRVMLYLESLGTLVAGLSGYKELSITLAALLIVQVILYIGFLSYYAKKY